MKNIEQEYKNKNIEQQLQLLISPLRILFCIINFVIVPIYEIRITSGGIVITLCLIIITSDVIS